jgi:hypothetical protein
MILLLEKVRIWASSQRILPEAAATYSRAQFSDERLNRCDVSIRNEDEYIHRLFELYNAVYGGDFSPGLGEEKLLETSLDPLTESPRLDTT